MIGPQQTTRAGLIRKVAPSLIVKTYQSHVVLETLQNGQNYYARRNLGFDAAYQGLIHLLGLQHCVSPIFGYLKGHKGCTDGKISSSVLLTLNVPDECVWLTEYNVWADYMYCVMHYTHPHNHTRVIPNEEYSQRRFDALQKNLKEQRSPSHYEIPQAVMESIKPEWLISASSKPLSPLHRFVHQLFNR